MAVKAITAAEWVDNDFAPLDTRTGAETLADKLNEIADETPELIPQVELDVDDDVPGPELPEDPALREKRPAAPPPPEPEPQVTQFDDGSSVTVEKKGNIWIATCSAGHGVQPEVFKGRTKDEMWQNVALGKINATKKIRQMTRREKLGGTPAATPQAPIEPRVRELTADETFELKTQLEANPALAFDTYLQKRTGMTPHQLVALIEKGQRAEELLDVEAVCKGFVAEHDDYYVCPENFQALIGYLYKQKLHKILGPKDDGEAAILELLRAGHFTVDNLNTAFEDLTDSGLLEVEPPQGEPEPDVVPPAPKPALRTTPPAAPASERIVRTVKRPRAGLGISPRETSTHISQPDTERPPSDDEAKTMPLDDLRQLITQTRALRARQELQR